jgi:hypothetical protein
MASFHVDGRVCVKMEAGLAVRLGDFLVESDVVDKQLKALGYRLVELYGDGEVDGFDEDAPQVPTYAPVAKTYVPGSNRPAPGTQPVFQHRGPRRIS